MTNGRDSKTHPFGGCNKLYNQYQIIGAELIKVERGSVGDSFHHGVAFIPVEVLESYLDDLLDSGIKDERLFIVNTAFFVHPRSALLALAGFLISLAVGLYAASTGASLFLSFCTTLLFALPGMLLLHFYPRLGLMRRMSFAQIVSAEIGNRRGQDRGSRPKSSTRILFEEMLAAQGKSLQGAAKIRYH